MDSDYPNTPGWVSGSDTSKLAAKSAQARKNVRADIYEAIIKEASGQSRLISCEDVETIANQRELSPGRHQEVSGRIRDALFISRQCIYKTATCALTGQPVKFWFGSSKAGLVVDEDGDVVFLKRPNKGTKEPAWLYGWQLTPHFIPPKEQQSILRMDKINRAWKGLEYDERLDFLRQHSLRFDSGIFD